MHGYEPSEVDLPHHVADGSVPGVKAAAVRKLLHELGIPSEQLPVSRIALSPSLCSTPAPSSSRQLSGNKRSAITSQADLLTARPVFDVGGVRWGACERR